MKKREYGPISSHLADLSRNNDRVRLLFKYGLFSVLLLDAILIMYVLVSIIFRLQVGGLTLIDSIPIAMYAFPLFVFLTLVIRAHLNEMSKIPAMIVMLIASAIFAIISPLGVGFALTSFVNILSACWIFLIAKVEIKVEKPSITKKTIAYLIFLNLIGFLFPASVYFMGSNPIAQLSYDQSGSIYVGLDMDNITSGAVTLNYDSSLLQQLGSTGLDLDILVHYDNDQVWSVLNATLTNITSHGIQYSITFDAGRRHIVDSNITTLGTTELLEKMYHRYNQLLTNLTNFLGTYPSLEKPIRILYDYGLSPVEFSLLMKEVSEVDLFGFSMLVSDTIASINQTRIEEMGDMLYNQTTSIGIPTGLIVDTIAYDDSLDADSTIMLACGATPALLSKHSENHIRSLRSVFASYMQGDVGEYFCFAFSNLEPTHFVGLQLGHISDENHLSANHQNPYVDLTTLTNDIAISLANGAESITIMDLSSALLRYGSNFIYTLDDMMQSIDTIPITYTFRIYAFRAVIQAVDSFI